jgi:hypothetical protein
VLPPRNQETILDRLAESRMADFSFFSFGIAPKKNPPKIYA